MPKRVAIHSKQTPSAIGCYSPSVQVGNLIFISGQIGLEFHTQQLVSQLFLPQLVQTFRNLELILGEATLSLDAIVKLTVYLKDITFFSQLNETMSTLFQPPYPARAVLEVSALPKGALVEVEAIAKI